MPESGKEALVSSPAGPSELLQIEVAKLGLELEQVRFDLRKLQDSDESPSDWIGKITKFLGVLTILAGIVAAGVEVSRYFDDRKESRKFEITREIIDLDRHLSGPNVPEQKDAARLLAALGTNSTRVLIESDDPINVVSPLIESANRVIDREISDENLNPNARVLLAHVDALGTVATELGTYRPYNLKRQEMRDILSDLQTRIDQKRFDGQPGLQDLIEHYLEQI
jgi:hypothetical protein